MLRTVTRVYRLGLIFGLTGLLVACGSSTSTAPQSPGSSVPAVVSLAISPASVALGTGQNQSTQFTATVSGSSNAAVTWSVNGVTGGNAAVGTISSDGLYTSPAAPTSATATVTATSAADSTKSASSSVVLVTSGKVASTQNPQVAQYSFTSPTDGSLEIEFGTDTSYGLETWIQPFPSGGGTLNMLVAGMRANTAYHMRASVLFAGGAQYLDSDHTFTTGVVDPARVPQVTVTQSSTLKPSPGIELLDLVLGSSTALQAGALDLQGNLIWYYDFANQPDYVPGDVVNPIKLMPDGTMLSVVSNPAVPTGAQSALIRKIDLAGNTIWELTGAELTQKLAAAGYNITIDSMHHDFAALPNGHLILLCNTTQNFTGLTGYPGSQAVIGDLLVDLDPNMNVSWVWNAFDHTDVLSLNRHLMGLPDWLHSNSLFYSPTDGNLILSMRHQSWVIKIDYRNGAGAGDILWKLGYQGDFKLVGGNDPTDWFYGQHYAYAVGPQTAGVFRLGLFDDGNLRLTDSNGDLCGVPGQIACYSTAPIFQINEPGRTATVLWRDTLSFFSFFAGNMQVLSNSDVEWGAGSTLAQSFTGPFATSIGEVTQTNPPQMVWQLDVTGQDSYRTLRIPSLYPGVTW